LRKIENFFPLLLHTNAMPRYGLNNYKYMRDLPIVNPRKRDIDENREYSGNVLISGLNPPHGW
jgi:hypothetical protein